MQKWRCPICGKRIEVENEHSLPTKCPLCRGSSSKFEFLGGKSKRVAGTSSGVKPKIPAKIQEDIAEIEKKIRNFHLIYRGLCSRKETEQEQLRQETQNVEAQYRADLKKVDQIKRNYQNQIEADKDTLAMLGEMLKNMPPKYAQDYVPGQAICPPSIDLDLIRKRYEMVITDTFETAMKRKMKKDGYYDWRQMTLDFMRMLEEAELCLNQHINSLMSDCTRAVRKAEQTAEFNKSNANANLLYEMEDKRKNLSNSVQKLNQNRTAFLASELVTGFDRRIERLLVDTGYSDYDWSSYNPLCKMASEFAMGNIIVPINAESVSLAQALEQKISCFHAELGTGKAEFQIPIAFSNEHNYRFYYRYTEESRADVINEVQSFLLKKMRSFPSDSIQTYVVDPVGRGGNLGILKASKEANELIGLEMCNAKDDIRKMLLELENSIDDTMLKLGKSSSVKEYNANNKNQIPEKVLVLFDFPEYFNSDMIESLSAVILNSDKCGIDIVISSEHYTSDLKKIDNTSRTDWTAFEENFWWCIDAKNSGWTLSSISGDYLKNYVPCTVSNSQKAFVDLYRQKYADSLKIDNTFSHIFCTSKQMEYKDATKGIVLPVMIRNEKKGELCNFVIGANADSTHALITGSTGSGKSSFLHMLITSILLNYHPDDVEFWMIDYGKVEFAQYATNRPASIRFLSTERSEEFTFSFLDYMKSFFEHRATLFAKEGINDIKAYRAKYGRLSMPRVILMIDEFHIMTQQVQQDIRYKNLLENSLTDYRKYGLSCIFSNQTLSALNGLSDTGKKQIKKRIAMMNSLDEMKLTLDVQNDNYSEEMIHRMERTTTGELWCKEQISDRDFTINQFMAVYIDDKERNAVLNSIVARPVVPQVDCEVHVINDAKREEISIRDFRSKISSTQSNRITPIHIGVPVTIEREFHFNMESRYNHNILILGRDLELSQGLVEVLMANIYAQGDAKLLVFADQMDDVYQNLQDNGAFDKYNNIEVLDNTSDICIKVNELCKQIKSKKILRQKTFILWLGYPDIFDEFNVSPAKKDVKFAEETVCAPKENIGIDLQKALQDEELIAMAKALDMPLEDLVRSICQVEEPVEVVDKDDYSYNACDDVNTLIQMGGKFNLFTTMVFASHSDIRRIKGFDLNTFIHKIATSMPKEESYEWGLKAFAADLEAKTTAVYYDGEKARKFRPYIIKS